MGGGGAVGVAEESRPRWCSVMGEEAAAAFLARQSDRRDRARAVVSAAVS